MPFSNLSKGWTTFGMLPDESARDEPQDPHQYVDRPEYNTHESLGLTSPERTVEARQQQDGSVRLPEAFVPYVGKETPHPAK